LASQGFRLAPSRLAALLSIADAGARAAVRASVVATVLTAVLAAYVAPAQAGPPFATDDPEPVERGGWEVNYALTGVRYHGGSTGFAPQVDANYGIGTGIQLHIQPQMAYATAPGSGSYGLGDTELGLKVRLTAAPSSDSDHDNGWMVSVYPLYEIPTGTASRGLGGGASSAYLPIWFQRTIGGWTTYGGGGYWINAGAGRRNAWAGGWVALYQWTDRLQLGCELYAETADSVGGQGSSRFNLGGSYALSKDYGLLFSVGRGIGAPASTEQFAYYLGLQVIY
jgi:hypothetical protein